jgi:competence protein ComFB
MEIHNISEDKVFASMQNIFAAIKKEGNPEGFCLCDQCKQDTICFALNRVEPRYIASNRGITRLDQDWAGLKQTDADIASLIYRGLQQVNHNQRQNIAHDDSVKLGGPETGPSFKIPTIMGRLFDGATFTPLDSITVELRANGELVPMRNPNWQNPFTLVSNTPGAFSFWPAPVPADRAEEHRMFEYSLKVEAPQYETQIHFFKIPVMSNIQDLSSFSPERTFKLPDLYMFRPDEDITNEE